ncbi:hypothetical protein [Methylobacterium sp. GC_Met_2]|uniref:hypothetical protein n=1 Tax=Methylobacterium sp. GC_Met_2 TaxID=2937376 RepID=UPI00226B83AD|nr:hypothetical protein [Methylobacterium sp. GC_Met_2]
MEQVANSKGHLMRVEEAVEVLTSDRPSRYLFERELAVAAFSGWLNSPDDPQGATTTVFAALCGAVLQAREHGINPPIEWLTEVYDDRAYMQLLENVIAIPIFWLIDEHKSYNNCNYTADVVRFLLTFKPKSEDKRKRASLGKAWEFINKHGGFVRGNFGRDRKDWCSISNHQVLWRRYKRSAPLQCARFHGAKFDWYLDPRQPDFFQRLSATAARKQELKTFFSAALHFQLELKAIIDRRSMAANDFFQFPDMLTPLDVRLPAMTATAYGKMAAYRRSTNLSEPVWD